jgi:hypothetical protein
LANTARSSARRSAPIATLAGPLYKPLICKGN